MSVGALARAVPLLLTALRPVLAVIIALLTIYHPTKSAFGICLIAAFLSDVFDGIIARRLKLATHTLRRLDSIADTLFYLAASFAAWHLHPQSIIDRLVPLAALVFLELSRYGLDMGKFGREASYHMWSSKLWGIALFAGFYSLLVLGRDDLLVSLMVYLGIVADLEGIAISLVLREWRVDVPSFFHAMAYNRRLSGAQGRITEV
jgi:phosphatidylglycerophosphate synthase